MNIILLRVNNYGIKQKKAWNIFFIICHQHQTRSVKIKANKTQQISVTARAFFVKTKLQHIQLQLLVNHFILLLSIFLLKSLTHEKINRIRIFLTGKR